MKEAKGGTFSPKDFKTIKKLIINALNPGDTEAFSEAEKVELKALYHRLGRFDD
jgi:hypothetical protein